MIKTLKTLGTVFFQVDKFRLYSFTSLHSKMLYSCHIQHVYAQFCSSFKLRSEISLTLGQVGKFQQLLSTFVGGFAVAFFKGWKLTLVMVATLPLLVFSFAALAAVMSKTSSKGQLAYAEAGTTVEQVVSAIRTVRNLNKIVGCKFVEFFSSSGWPGWISSFGGFWNLPARLSQLMG
jgi:ABC-type multidrug transport system fused ATPase/permease subunit